MARIKKKTSVSGIIPAEVVSAAVKDQDPSEALYNALSINVKPENETEEQRKVRLMRRQFMFNIFGASAEELETILKKNKEMHEDQGQVKSDLDILKDSEDVAKGQESSNKSGKALWWVGLGAEGVSAAGAVVGLLMASNPITIGFTIAGLAFKVLNYAVEGIWKSKIKKGNKADANEKNRAYQEVLETFVKKIEIINEILTSRMDEIMQKKKTLSEKDFREYKKGLIADIKQHMKEIGLEIVTKTEENGVEQEIKEETEESEKQEEKEEKEEKEEDKKAEEKKEPEKKEPENPEKIENVEMGAQ